MASSILPPSFEHLVQQRLERAIARAKAEREAQQADPELPPAAYLRDLAQRLLHVPVIHGIDGYDVDRLSEIARAIETR